MVYSVCGAALGPEELPVNYEKTQTAGKATETSSPSQKANFPGINQRKIKFVR